MNGAKPVHHRNNWNDWNEAQLLNDWNTLAD